MPIFGLESELSGVAKFVRNGEIIVYTEGRMSHAKLAETEGLGDTTGEEFTARLVDDAGLMLEMGGLVFFHNSATCKIRGSPRDARALTVAIASRVTGRPARSE